MVEKIKEQTHDKQVRSGRSPGFEIKVSEEIIKESIERHSGHCMVAEAVKARYPKARFVAVDIQTIRFTDTDKKERYTYLTPRSVQIAIIKFDQGKKPDPFTFRLRAGQITASGNSMERIKKNRDIKARHNAKQKQREKNALLRGIPGVARAVPEKIGGITPPTSIHRDPPVPGGIRRAFGLRAMEI